MSSYACVRMINLQNRPTNIGLIPKTFGIVGYRRVSPCDRSNKKNRDYSQYRRYRNPCVSACGVLFADLFPWRLRKTAGNRLSSFRSQSLCIVSLIPSRRSMHEVVLIWMLRSEISGWFYEMIGKKRFYSSQRTSFWGITENKYKYFNELKMHITKT